MDSDEHVVWGGRGFYRLSLPEDHHVAVSGLRADDIDSIDAEGGVRTGLMYESVEPHRSSRIGAFSSLLATETGQML